MTRIERMFVPMMACAETVNVVRHLRETGAEAVDHVLDLVEQLLVGHLALSSRARAVSTRRAKAAIALEKELM